MLVIMVIRVVAIGVLIGPVMVVLGACTQSPAPPSPRSLFQAGIAAYHADDVDGVAAAADALEDRWEYQAHVHLFRGMVLLRNGRLEEAMHELGEAKGHPDTRALSFLLAGEVLYRVGNLQGAESILRQALAYDDEDPATHRWLGAIYYDLGAMRQALFHLDRVAELDAADPRPSRLQGLINKDYEKFPRAVDAYLESLRRDPDQNDVRVELAECYVKLRDFQEALKVLEICPDSAEVLTLGAECHYAEGRQAAARRLLDRALETSPPLLASLLLRGTIALEQRDPEVVDFLEEAIGHYPSDFGLRHKLGQAYRHEGREQDANEQMKLSEELRELRYQFTDLHKEAMDNPRDAETRHQLGLVADKLGMPELAKNWFRAALVLDPHHLAAQQALREIATNDNDDLEDLTGATARP